MDSGVNTSAMRPNRKSQLFVEIPRSPCLARQDASTTEKVDKLSASHLHGSTKQNTLPLSEKTTMSNLPGQKRKALHDHEDIHAEAKKFKGETGEVICHQCRSRKPSKAILQCTRISQRKGERCKASYCSGCLRNRYGEDIEKLRQTKITNTPQAHKDKDIGFTFNCPRCEGYCNCAPCRKKQGLPPVGKLAVGQASVREILEKNPQASGNLPKTSVNAITAIDRPPLETSDVKILGRSEKVDAGPKVSKQTAKSEPAKREIKEVPEPVWVPVPGTDCNFQDIEDRIFLREFILRFNPILNIGVRNLEDLDDFSSLHDPSAKAILLSLLDLIALESPHKKIIQKTIKTVRGSGLNWGNIVPALYALRDNIPQDHPLHNLPVLQTSDIEPLYNTRGTRLQGIHVDHTLPILLFLIEILLEGESVRLELEEGVKQAKEARAAFLKALKEETDKWASLKASLLEKKPKRDQKSTKSLSDPWKAKYREAETEHKRIVGDLRNYYKAEMDACSCRFVPLGCDMDGRTYYILSSSGPQKGKKDRLPSETDCAGMRRWGWFVAVFGRPGTVTQLPEDDDMETDSESDNGDRWWGFASTDEMRKLSKWLSYRAELQSSPSLAPVSSNRSFTPLSQQEEEEATSVATDSACGTKSLAKSIMAFADFIEWRLAKGSMSSNN